MIVDGYLGSDGCWVLLGLGCSGCVVVVACWLARCMQCWMLDVLAGKDIEVPLSFGSKRYGGKIMYEFQRTPSTK